VDDIGVYTNAWEDHLRHVESTLQKVNDSGLKLAIRKSEFAKPEVTFCGSIVGSGKRNIDPSKIQDIENLRRPETKAQVRQILGLLDWFRDYIPYYAEHAIPLSNLTSQRIPNHVPWGEIEDNSFVTLKDLLCKAVDQPLSIIDWSKPYNIFTDASDLASGGVLSQADEHGKEQPTVF
jgi:RNase H-like domain found in reverse transcriptase